MINGNDNTQHSPSPLGLEHLLTPEALHLIATLHRKFEKRRQQLLAVRERKNEHYDQGALPRYNEYLKNHEINTDWKVAAIPFDLQTRRVEITGPVNDTKMVINMLNRNAEGDRADMAMVDFEDSMKPSWPNVLNGVQNVLGASLGELEVTTPKKTYRLNPHDSAKIMVRVRGLHLYESNIKVDDQIVAAGLVDLALCYFHTANNFIKNKQTPKFYIPKIEYASEARWWNDIFNFLEDYMGHPRSTLRATFLIETLPAAFQIEEILFELKDHIVAMNVGRWDKIFSDIKTLKNHPHRISPNRSEITMDKFWMENYAKRLIKICHRRGAYAIGGMSACTPGKEENVRKAQVEKVVQDKTKEFTLGHDGCWVSHPYFIGPALNCFTRSNQVDIKLEDFEEFPKLIMNGSGPRTLEGLMVNIEVGIAYLHGWNQDLGCIAHNNLMEDLATLEISRAQVWQWLHYNVVLDEGMVVTENLIRQLFSQRLQNFLNDDMSTTERLAYTKAADDACELFLRSELAPFLTNYSDVYQEEILPITNLSNEELTQL